MNEFLFWRRFYNQVFDTLGFDDSASLHPAREILCYEANCAALKDPFPRKTSHNRNLPPSKMRRAYSDEELQEVAKFLQKKDAFRFNVLIRGSFDYPAKLLRYNFPLLYYRGDISLLSTPCVAVSGATNLTDDGLALTGNVVSELVSAGYGIVSGLAQGADTMAHFTALEMGGRCIAVIGTPIDQVAKTTISGLQEDIAHYHLLLSYVPFYRYSQMAWEEKRRYFPDRHQLVAATSMATIVTELSRANKTFSLAQKTVEQGKPLILCKEALRPGLAWTREYVRDHKAHVVEKPEEIPDLLEKLCRIG